MSCALAEGLGLLSDDDFVAGAAVQAQIALLCVAQLPVMMVVFVKARLHVRWCLICGVVVVECRRQDGFKFGFRRFGCFDRAPGFATSEVARARV